MARPSSKKIATDGPTAGAFSGAFAALSGENLPEGEETALPPPTTTTFKKGRVLLRKETAHRGGKSVLVLSGFSAEHDTAVLEALARQLRKVCGSGGALKGREIEIQGTAVARIREFLGAKGYQVAGIREA